MLHLQNYPYIKMIDPTLISQYLTKNSQKVDIMVNFSAVAIHPYTMASHPSIRYVIALHNNKAIIVNTPYHK